MGKLFRATLGYGSIVYDGSLTLDNLLDEVEVEYDKHIRAEVASWARVATRNKLYDAYGIRITCIS